ncbi:MAG: sigma-70 family RNA polymerase sigma factor [Planctomycetota bacterium]
MGTRPAIDLQSLLEHGPMLRALARALVPPAEVDDVVQGTMAAAAAAPARRADWPLPQWLGGVARNLARRGARDRARRAARERLAAQPEAQSPAAEVAAREEVRRSVLDAVLALDEPQRTVVLLRFYDGLKPREIAARLALPGTTVRSHLHRALERLRARLDREHGGDRRAWALPLLPLLSPPTAPLMTFGGLAMSAKLLFSTAAAALLMLITWLALREPDPAIATTADARVETGGAPAAAAAASIPDAPQRTAAPQPAPRATVVSAVDQRPLAAAEVEVRFADGSIRTHRTGADGAFAPDWDEAVTLWLSAPGFAPRLVADVTPVEDDRAFELHPGHAIALRYVTADGRVLTADELRELFHSTGVLPSVAVLTAQALEADGLDDLIRTRLGAPEDWQQQVPLHLTDDGAAVAARADGGRVRLLLPRPGAAPMVTAVLDLAAGEPRTLDVPMPEETAVEVRFVDGDDGTPLAGAEVMPFVEFGDDWAFVPVTPVRTDRDGRVRLYPQTPKSPETLRAASWWVMTPTHASTFDPRSSQSLLEVRVPRRGDVTGAVVCPDGADPAGMWVGLGIHKGPAFRTQVGADGRFALRALPAGQALVAAWSEERGAGSALMTQTTVPPGAVAEITVGEAGGGATVRGRITAAGRPLANVLVLAQPTERQQRRAASTAADGTYELLGLSSPARLMVLFGDFQVSDDYRIRSHEPMSLSTDAPNVFDFDVPGGRLRVRVTDPQGRPLVGVGVTANPADRDVQADRFAGFGYRAGWSATTGADGIALLLGLPEGEPTTVRAGGQGFERVRQDVPAPATDDAAPPIELVVDRSR